MLRPKTLAALAATAALGTLLVAGPARAGSAIVIVVENCQKAGDDIADTNPLLLEAVAIPAERALKGVLEREIERAAPRPAPEGRRPRAPRRPGTEPKKEAPRFAPKLPKALRAWIDEQGPRILREVIEPNIDRYGEAFYGKLLELAAARSWDHVVVLTDDEARFDRFQETVRDLDQRGYTIDVIIDIHGSSSFTELDNGAGRGPDRMFFTGGSVTADRVAALGGQKKLDLNAVYSVACWGSRFNDAWVEAGARAANGARELNYYVLVSPLAFIYAFGQGLDLDDASERAYRIEKRLFDRDLLDEALAPMYGRRDADRVHTAKSSSRVHKGPKVRAACFPAAEPSDASAGEPR